jgi:hypothetical protein
MAPSNRTQLARKEADILLAISAIESNQIESGKRAAAIYRVPETSVRRRRSGILPRHECVPSSKKLTKFEEQAITQYIINLDSRGFGPSLSAVREMANKLLAEREAGQVGKQWLRNFVNRTQALKTRFDRPYDRQRALCEDPQVITQWFELIQRTKLAYGICEEDIWNFDETGFMMGKISSKLVVTSSERRNMPKSIQPGQREWVTVIQGVSAGGVAIPPFIIFAGQHHLSAWYEGSSIPQDWLIGISENGWTNNELGVKWLQHFVAHTKASRIGGYQLLILDGHESHNSIGFQELCTDNNIIALCMPPHSSHLLQPLDVGCFSPLKRAYGSQIGELIRNHINHITKAEFLIAFHAAYNLSITKANICTSFEAAGIVPLNPERVVSKLDVRLRTPTPPPDVAIWESKTPSNPQELDCQSTLVRNRIQQHQNSSPTPVIQSLNRLTKGASLMVHEIALLRGQVSSLQKANDAASKRKQRKRKRIQKQGTLTIAEAQEIITQNSVNQQLEGEIRQGRGQSGTGRRAATRCGRCKEIGHNLRTCKQAA